MESEIVTSDRTRIGALRMPVMHLAERERNVWRGIFYAGTSTYQLDFRLIDHEGKVAFIPIGFTWDVLDRLPSFKRAKL